MNLCCMLQTLKCSFDKGFRVNIYQTVYFIAAFFTSLLLIKGMEANCAYKVKKGKGLVKPTAAHWWYIQGGPN